MPQPKKRPWTLRLATAILDRHRLIFLLYLAALVFSLFSMGWVQVEQDVTSYLDEDSQTRRGLQVMGENFAPFATARVMVSGIGPGQAQALQQQLQAIEGIELALFDTGPDHYRQGSALFELHFSGGSLEPSSLRAMEQLQGLLAGYDYLIDSQVGQSQDQMLDREMGTILLVAGAIALLVLVLTSRSYGELPVLLLTFAAAALLNMGSNFLLGKISFISDSVAPVLQLALAIDYAIILCHRFSDQLEHSPPRQAAITALARALPEIGASCLTTVCGLGALGFMRFTIGLDLALVLIKAVGLSLLSVLTLMPGLLLRFAPLMARSRHRRLLPRVAFLGKFAVKARRWLPPLAVPLLLGACWLSGHCPLAYSFQDLRTTRMSPQQEAYFAIEERFGGANLLALLVPAGDYGAEARVLQELEACPQVKGTLGLAGIRLSPELRLTDSLSAPELSRLLGLDPEAARALYALYALEKGGSAAGAEELSLPLPELLGFLQGLPEGSLPVPADPGLTRLPERLGSALAQLQSERYSRMVVYLDLPQEGPETFAFLDTVRDILARHYPGDFYMLGNSTAARDLSASFASDHLLIGGLSALFVVLVLLLSFRSLALPLLLILVIQGSVWINFSIPTLTGQPLYFLGYLIVNAVMMGANIDYAIVISSHYREYRAALAPGAAMGRALEAAFPTVITSGAILASAGLLIGWLSAQPVVAVMGICLGRGTLLSLLLVLGLLPSVLLLGDGLIRRSHFSALGRRPPKAPE